MNRWGIHENSWTSHRFSSRRRVSTSHTAVRPHPHCSAAPPTSYTAVRPHPHHILQCGPTYIIHCVRPHPHHTLDWGPTHITHCSEAPTTYYTAMKPHPLHTLQWGPTHIIHYSEGPPTSYTHTHTTKFGWCQIHDIVITAHIGQYIFRPKNRSIVVFVILYFFYKLIQKELIFQLWRCSISSFLLFLRTDAHMCCTKFDLCRGVGGQTWNANTISKQPCTTIVKS